MKASMRATLTLLAVLCGCVISAALPAAEFEWRTATLESQGMSSPKLRALQEELAARRTRAFLVIRNDKIVHEWYADGVTAEKRQGTASLAKAIVGGLSLAVAINDGLISIDDPAWEYVPQWKDDPQRSKITVRHLGSHTSGIDDSHNREEQARGVDQGSYTGWSGEFWRWRGGQQRPPNDAFSISRDAAPMLFEPGADFQYSNPGLAMLGYCVTSSLKGTPHADIRTLLRERIMRPIGAKDEEWSCGYGLTENVGGLPMVANWGGGSYTPRAAARIGRLVLRRGDWDGERLLSEKALEDMTSDAGLPGHCGMGWWTNSDGRYAKVPRDAVWGAGAGDQVLLVVPSLNLIMVRNGGSLGDDRSDRDARVKVLFEPLIDSVTDKDPSATDSQQSSKAPYPPSPLIESASFDFSSEQVFGKGSDQWPMTWSGDGHVYAAWGDGWGWSEDRSTPKRSIGVTRITGTPPALNGEDLWGDGPGSGFGKPEALIALGETLYMFWTRGDSTSDDDTATAVSRDGGVTWTYGKGKAFPQAPAGFRVRGICQFGPGYKDAMDDFVYVYFGMNRATDLFLGRVPREHLFDPEQYEWFTRVRDDGNAEWSGDFADRDPVFQDPNGYVWHVDVCHHPGLNRFLLSKPHYGPGTDRQTVKPSEGGVASFGLFDAPKPWGPWTTVAYQDNFKDDLVKFSYFIPRKFLGGDGRTFWLAWSGWPEYDSVSFVRGELVLRERNRQ